MIDRKYTILNTTSLDPAVDIEDETRKIDILKTLINLNWSDSITRLARCILTSRKLHQNIELPSPEDVKSLTIHLTTESRKLAPALDVAKPKAESFSRAVCLSQSTLVLGSCSLHMFNQN